MIYLTFATAYSLLALFTLRIRRSQLLLWPTLIIIFLLLNINSRGPDFEAYENMFSSSGEEYAEIGYAYLIAIVKYFGGRDHSSMLFVLSLLVLITLIRFSIRSQRFHAVLPIYLIFLFPVDVIQVRNTFASFLLLNAVIDFRENKKIRAFLFCCLASLFHYFFVLLAVNFFIAVFAKKYLSNLIIALLVAVSFVLGPFFINYIVSEFQLRTFEHYLSDGKFSSVIIWGGAALLIVNFLKFIEGRTIFESGKGKVFFEIGLSYIFCSILFVSGLYYLYEFNRFYRFIIFLSLFVVASIHSKEIKKHDYLLRLFLIVLSLLFAIHYNSAIDYDSVIYPW